MYALRSYLGAWDRGAMPPSMAIRPSHRRRSGWNSGGRMASAEGASVLSGVRDYVSVEALALIFGMSHKGQ